MKNRMLSFLFGFVLLFSVAFTSCGPSAEEQRKQEIEDSLRLEEERRQLLDRANQMMDKKEEDEQKATREEPED